MEQQWQRLDGTAIRHPIEEEVRSVLARERSNGHQLKVCIGTFKAKPYAFASSSCADKAV